MDHLKPVPEPPEPRSDPADLALRRAHRFLRRIKHEPFVAIVVDRGVDKVDVFHTTGIDLPKINAIRRILDELENRLLSEHQP